jgi:hypothetical protein
MNTTTLLSYMTPEVLVTMAIDMLEMAEADSIEMVEFNTEEQAEVYRAIIGAGQANMGEVEFMDLLDERWMELIWVGK